MMRNISEFTNGIFNIAATFLIVGSSIIFIITSAEWIICGDNPFHSSQLQRALLWMAGLFLIMFLSCIINAWAERNTKRKSNDL